MEVCLLGSIWKCVRFGYLPTLGTSFQVYFRFRRLLECEMEVLMSGYNSQPGNLELGMDVDPEMDMKLEMDLNPEIGLEHVMDLKLKWKYS